jgi:hypothetical protein
MMSPLLEPCFHDRDVGFELFIMSLTRKQGSTQSEVFFRKGVFASAKACILKMF